MLLVKNRVLLIAAASVLYLAACKKDNPSGAEQGSSTVEPTAKAQGKAAKRIESLPQVDVSAFDDGSKSMWVDLVNEFLSPCGEPVSVAACVADNNTCRKCIPAARYVARLVNEGFQRDEIRDFYRLRYDKSTLIKLTEDGSPSRGGTMAPVVIYEFSDFQCPHCMIAAPELKRVVDASDGKVRLVFKHFPLSGHLRARDAAIATVAAGKQGKFWQMHDLLFENQERLEPADIQKYAKKLDLDLTAFNKDLADKSVAKKVDDDREQGRAAGVEGTPSVFVNGRSFSMPLEMLPAYIKEELDG